MLFLLRCIIAAVCLTAMSPLFATENVVNVYTWAEEIPSSVIRQFEKETGITVHYTTYDSNEAMYAKLRARKKSGYDLIEPSSYYAERMRHQNKIGRASCRKECRSRWSPY